MYTHESKRLPSFIVRECAQHKQLTYHVSKTTRTFTCVSVWYSMIGRTVCLSQL